MTWTARAAPTCSSSWTHRHQQIRGLVPSPPRTGGASSGGTRSPKRWPAPRRRHIQHGRDRPADAAHEVRSAPVQQPPGALGVRPEVGRIEGPGDGLPDCPASGSVAVKTQLGGQTIKAPEHGRRASDPARRSARWARHRTPARRSRASDRSPATAHAAPRGHSRRGGPDGAAPAALGSGAARRGSRRPHRAADVRTAGRTPPIGSGR